MAVINNTFSQIDDAAIVKIQFGITGIVLFYDFDDVVNGETPNRYFKKEFRLSQDGITFDPWKEITLSGLGFEVIILTGLVVIEVRYTRKGTDQTGLLSWSSFDFQALNSRSYLKKIDNLNLSLYPSGWVWKSKPIIEEKVIDEKIGALEDELESEIVG